MRNQSEDQHPVFDTFGEWCLTIFFLAGITTWFAALGIAIGKFFGWESWTNHCSTFSAITSIIGTMSLLLVCIFARETNE